MCFTMTPITGFYFVCVDLSAMFSNVVVFFIYKHILYTVQS